MPLRPASVKSAETGTTRAALLWSQWTQGDASACSASATRTLWFNERTSPQVQRPRTARPPTRAPRHRQRSGQYGPSLGPLLLRRSGLGLQRGHHAQIGGRGGHTRSTQSAQAAGPARRKRRPTVAERARATKAETAPWAILSTCPLGSASSRLQQPPDQIPAGGPPRTSAQSRQTWQQRRRRPRFLPSALNAWWSGTA